MHTVNKTAISIGLITEKKPNLSCRRQYIFFGNGVQARAQMTMNGSNLKSVYPIASLAKSAPMPTSCFAVSAIAVRSEWKKIIQPKPTMISE